MQNLDGKMVSRGLFVSGVEKQFYNRNIDWIVITLILVNIAILSSMCMCVQVN